MTVDEVDERNWLIERKWQLQTQSDGSQNDNCDCEAIDMRPVINIVHPPGQSRGWAARGGEGKFSMGDPPRLPGEDGARLPTRL